jgi:hypothetical protein
MKASRVTNLSPGNPLIADGRLCNFGVRPLPSPLAVPKILEATDIKTPVMVNGIGMMCTFDL